MRRCIPKFIVALCASAMMILLALPSYAQVEGDYAGYGEDYYGEGAGPGIDAAPPIDYERPYLALGLSSHPKPDYPDYKDVKPDFIYDKGYGKGYGYDTGYGKPDYFGAGYYGKGGYDDGRYAGGHRGDGYSAYAYNYGYGYKKRKPRWRKTCVYGPLREKKVCDYEPRHCWKERECYYVYGKKYCRYYTKCKGGDKSCYWIKKRTYGNSYCGEVY